MNKRSALLAGCAMIVAGCASATANSSAPPAPSASRAVVVTPSGRTFSVASPGGLLLGISGPAPRNQGPCRASSVTAAAETKQANDGVLGIITLIGHACSLAVNPAGMRLLDVSGRPLPVSTTPAGGVNPASSIRPDLEEGQGSVGVGFSWTGSYCGSGPVLVQIPALPAPLRVAVKGPLPACLPGTSSQLTPGVVAGPNAAVEPAPPAWASLRARLLIPKTVTEGPIPMSIVLATIGDTDVSLSAPCPAYVTTLSFPIVAGRGFGGGGGELESVFGDLCSRPLVVHPGHPLTLRIPPIHYTPEGPWKVGATLSAQWAMAGVPTATADATIR